VAETSYLPPHLALISPWCNVCFYKAINLLSLVTCRCIWDWSYRSVCPFRDFQRPLSTILSVQNSTRYF